MCKGISVSKSRIPRELIEEFDLMRRVSARVFDDPDQLHFMYTDPVVQLPVIHDGRTAIYEWGNRGNKDSKLPQTGWCRLESVEAGKWRWLSPERVIIPADFGVEKKTWFEINEGLEGVLVRDEQQQPHVYVLTQPASESYERLTTHYRMPLSVGQEM
jgi:hypothetical protein